MAPFDPPLSPDEVPRALHGRFARLCPLKSGGQGTVFRASVQPNQPIAAGQEVALKIYYADQVEERTAREIAALQKLQSDVLVRLIGTGRIELRGFPCIWTETEFIEGQSLASRIGGGALGVGDVATFTHDVAAAIELLWGDRIVHRDIKPDNVMVRLSGRGVLIDLGVARHTALSSLTTYGKTWGTDGYLSPEQAQTRRALTCKSDIFALGIVAQEALLGRHPTNRRQGLLLGGGPSTNALQKDLPADLVRAIDRMVARDSHARPLPRAVMESMRPHMNS